jgi:hypothetical protein
MWQVKRGRYRTIQQGTHSYSIDYRIDSSVSSVIIYWSCLRAEGLGNERAEERPVCLKNQTTVLQLSIFH